jgi:hypothetical protein
MMKTRWLIFSGCFFALLLLFLPVSANPMIPIMTEVFISQNGIPVNDTVDFSLDCYGKTINWPGGFDFKKYGLGKAPDTTGDVDAVYSYGATCRPTERCFVYKPDTPWTIRISHCDLRGTYKDQPFLLKNFSREPMLTSTREIKTLGTGRETYTIPQKEWRQCKDQQSRSDRDCEKKFIDQNSPPGTSGVTPEYWQCQNKSFEVLLSCMRSHGTPMNETDVRQAQYYYELRFDIPSGDEMRENRSNPGIVPDLVGKDKGSPIIPFSDTALKISTIPVSPARRSPVESLYCSILDFFGTSC